MAKARKYSPEVRERAVRLVFEHQEEYASQWAAISSIAEKIGCTPETLRSWVRRAERDTGRRPGLTTDERAHLKELEREVRELRRANEILRKASVRAKVEHPFLYVKRRFGYRKVRYRGLAKNMERIALLLGFANLLVAGRYSTA